MVRPHPSQATNKPTTFEHQLVNVRIGHHVIAVATVHRPPSTSKSTFLVEFTDLFTSLSLQSGDRLLFCGDMNMPGCNPGTIDDDLLELLDQLSMMKHVGDTTHYSTACNRENIQNLIITPTTSNLISAVLVVNSHHLSDHSLIVCELQSVEQKQLHLRK